MARVHVVKRFLTVCGWLAGAVSLLLLIVFAASFVSPVVITVGQGALYIFEGACALATLESYGMAHAAPSSSESLLLLSDREPVPLWPIVLAMGAATGLLAFCARRRHPTGRCRACGYDLTGNVSGRCPECGAVRRSTARRNPARRHTVRHNPRIPS
ncbi:MAG: hypothetical protein PVJ57_00675 [Phycisphaerae bacterium]|jgi:hypothetical protein